MSMPPPEVCARIRALHILLDQFDASLAAAHHGELLKLLGEHQLNGNDLPQIFYHLNIATTKQVPQSVRERIVKLHARISATKAEWTAARKKLKTLLNKDGLTWELDLPAILAADWLKNNPTTITSGTTAAATAPTTPAIDLFDLNVAVIEDRVVMSNEDVIVAALWGLVSFVYREFEYAPQLGLISPSSNCGKTTLLKVLNCIVADPSYTSHATAASIYRKLRRQPYTYLLDEAENQGLLQDAKLRAVLDAAYDGGAVDITIDGESVSIPVFAQIAWAVRGETRDVPGAVLSRTLVIHMKVGTPRKRRLRNDPELLVTYDENRKWATTVRLDLDPSIPVELSRNPRMLILAARCWPSPTIWAMALRPARL
jgi:hypothetical protein